MHRFFAGLSAAVFIICGFILGCVLDFLSNPLDWIQAYWAPTLLLVYGIVGGIRNRWRC